MSSVEALGAYSSATWPDLIEVEACILRADSYRPANFATWWEK